MFYSVCFFKLFFVFALKTGNSFIFRINSKNCGCHGNDVFWLKYKYRLILRKTETIIFPPIATGEGGGGSGLDQFIRLTGKNHYDFKLTTCMFVFETK